VPDGLSDWALSLSPDGAELYYDFDANAEHTGVPSLLRRLSDLGIGFKDLATHQSSLEDIFVSLTSDRGPRANAAAQAGEPA
jgi:ABC-2 type transport system ATP-binding protein